MSAIQNNRLLTHPAVQELLHQGARDGKVSFAQINDLLIDLELDEDDVDLLLETLEKRAIAVSDEASVEVPAPKPRPTSAQSSRKPKAESAPSIVPQKSAANADLDALLAQLDEMTATDVADVAPLATDEGDGMFEDEFAPVEDALRLYLNRMGAIPRLSPEEERQLAHVVHGDDKEAALDAKNKLVESNLRLVVHLAHHAAPRTTLSITDLLQEGNLGLLDAVERYRPQSNKTFGAYATWWIRRAINRAINDHSRSMKLSGELYNAIQKMQVGQRNLTQKLGRTPSRAELAEFTGLSVPQIEEAQRAMVTPLSLDASSGGGDEGSELGENLADEATESLENAAIRHEVGVEVVQLLDELSDREKVVVQMRFGLGEFAGTGSSASEDVAKRLNISRERVHELELRALRKLRKKAKGSGLDKLFGDE